MRKRACEKRRGNNPTDHREEPLEQLQQFRPVHDPVLGQLPIVRQRQHRQQHHRLVRPGTPVRPAIGAQRLEPLGVLLLGLGSYLRRVLELPVRLSLELALPVDLDRTGRHAVPATRQPLSGAGERCRSGLFNGDVTVCQDTRAEFTAL